MCKYCQKLSECLVARMSSEDQVKLWCPIVMEKRWNDVLNPPAVFISGQQPSEIVRVVQKALNENQSMN